MKFNYGNTTKKSPKKPVTHMGDTMGSFGTSEFPVLASQKVINRFSIFIDNCLEDVQEMRQAVYVLGLAQDEDEVTIFLNSPGGSIDSCQMFMQAMQQCKAEIFVQGSGTIASAAAIILASANSFSLEPHTSILYHSASGGTYGAMKDNVEYSVFSKRQVERFGNYHTAGLFSRAELNRIYNEKFEHWMDVQEFCERFRRKVACVDIVEDVIQEMDISYQDITPEVFTEMMLDAVETYDAAQLELEAQKAKRKPAKRKQKPAALPEQTCSGSCECK